MRVHRATRTACCRSPKPKRTQDLRLDAIRRLGSNNAASAEVWQLYQSETSPEIRMQILRSYAQQRQCSTSSSKWPRRRRTPTSAASRFRVSPASAPLPPAMPSSRSTAPSRIPNVQPHHHGRPLLPAQRQGLVQLARNENDLKMKQQIGRAPQSNMKVPGSHRIPDGDPQVKPRPLPARGGPAAGRPAKAAGQRADRYALRRRRAWRRSSEACSPPSRSRPGSVTSVPPVRDLRPRLRIRARRRRLHGHRAPGAAGPCRHPAAHRRRAR